MARREQRAGPPLNRRGAECLLQEGPLFSGAHSLLPWCQAGRVGAGDTESRDSVVRKSMATS